MADASGRIGGQAFFVGGEIAHSPCGAWVYGVKVEHHDIGEVAFLEIAAPFQVEDVGLGAGELSDGCFNRH